VSGGQAVGAPSGYWSLSMPTHIAIPSTFADWPADTDADVLAIVTAAEAIGDHAQLLEGLLAIMRKHGTAQVIA
jgi:hypothetical protein